MKKYRTLYRKAEQYQCFHENQVQHCTEINTLQCLHENEVQNSVSHEMHNRN